MAEKPRTPYPPAVRGSGWSSAGALLLVGLGGVVIGSQLFGGDRSPLPAKPDEHATSDEASAFDEQEPAQEITRSEVTETSGREAPEPEPSGASGATHPNTGHAALQVEGGGTTPVPSSSLAPGTTESRDESKGESPAENQARSEGGEAAPDAGANAEPAESEPQPAASSPTPEELIPGGDCGMLYCLPGYRCCNPSCGTCAAPGESCDETPCTRKINYPVSIPCGRSTCNNGQVCCNESCGTCVDPGGSCDPAPCDNAIQYPISIYCGRNTCSSGKICCNLSCGICVEPGETCSHELCN